MASNKLKMPARIKSVAGILTASRTPLSGSGRSSAKLSLGRPDMRSLKQYHFKANNLVDRVTPNRCFSPNSLAQPQIGKAFGFQPERLEQYSPRQRPGCEQKIMCTLKGCDSWSLREAFLFQPFRLDYPTFLKPR